MTCHCSVYSSCYTSVSNTVSVYNVPVYSVPVYSVSVCTSIQCTSVHISVYSPLYGKWQRMRETESLKCNLFFPLSFSFHLKCSPGFLLWVVRGLLCRALQEPNGRTVLVTGCDTGIGHEVAGLLITHQQFLYQTFNKFNKYVTCNQGSLLPQKLTISTKGCETSRLTRVHCFRRLP